MKPETVFACKNCGAQFPKWMGRCTECGAWGTIEEDTERDSKLEANGSGKQAQNVTPAKVEAFSSLNSRDATALRLATGIKVWDELLGGFVTGSVTLFAGEPGSGKSTLITQLALALSSFGKKIFYVTGEESPAQVLMRLERLAGGEPHVNLHFIDNNDARMVAASLMVEKPMLAIVDSIQTMTVPGVSGEVGSPTQVKAAAATLAACAKDCGVPIVLVGQVTKDGDVAGPRQLEHLVDTVLMLEGERTHTFRYLRVLKHRFGETGDSALLRMTARGLDEVADPSSALISDRPRGVSGSVVSVVLNGRRPLLVELQALVTPAGYGTPSRRVSGVDANRVGLLLAVMARRAGISFAEHDVFANVVGGLKSIDPATDLAAVMALASAKHDVPVPYDAVVLGEVGLAGEIRAVARFEERLKEAERLGFSQAIVPRQKIENTKLKIELNSFSNIQDALVAAGLFKMPGYRT